LKIYKSLVCNAFHQKGSYSRIWITLPTAPRRSPQNSNKNNDRTDNATMHKTPSNGANKNL